ncbi:MAG TPA: cytochrome P450 [Polyangiaceae bacterium]|nr:cytochrome P450 [Polyangiaceae bacterium]
MTAIEEPRAGACPRPAPAPVPAYPFGQVQALDLHPRYLELCRREPVSRVRMPYGGEAWLVTGYAEIKSVLSDPRFSSMAATSPDTARVTPLPLRPGGLLTMDPPEHARVRRVVAKAFNARAVARLSSRIERVCEGLLDELAAAGPPADVVERLAAPLPVHMICELFGIPYEERERFRQYSDVLVATFAYPAAQINEARERLEGYLIELMERRRREPADDLVAALVEATDVERLSATEAARAGLGVLMAGHETSLSMISNATYLVLSRPELYARLCERPEILPTAVEELLRVIPLRSTGSFPRRATEDVTLGGVLIRAGETVIFQRAAGDRDPRAFDEPDAIDLERRPNAHLGFGHGAHHCLGAQLARAELQSALGGLVRRFPGLRLAGRPEDVAWKPGLIARCPAALKVMW